MVSAMKFFFHEINAENLDNIWFQQEGDTFYKANATFNILGLIFGNRIISKNCNVVSEIRHETIDEIVLKFGASVGPLSSLPSHLTETVFYKYISNSKHSNKCTTIENYWAISILYHSKMKFQFLNVAPCSSHIVFQGYHFKKKHKKK